MQAFIGARLHCPLLLCRCLSSRLALIAAPVAMEWPALPVMHRRNFVSVPALTQAVIAFAGALCVGAVIATTPARAATPSEVTDPSPLLRAKMLGSASCLLGLFCACLGLLLGLSFACCSPQPFWFLSPAPLSSSGAAHGCPTMTRQP